MSACATARTRSARARVGQGHPGASGISLHEKRPIGRACRPIVEPLRIRPEKHQATAGPSCTGRRPYRRGRSRPALKRGNAASGCPVRLAAPPHRELAVRQALDSVWSCSMTSRKLEPLFRQSNVCRPNRAASSTHSSMPRQLLPRRVSHPRRVRVLEESRSDRPRPRFSAGEGERDRHRAR